MFSAIERLVRENIAGSRCQMAGHGVDGAAVGRLEFKQFDGQSAQV